MASQNNEYLLRRVTAASVCVTVVLIAIKLYVMMRTSTMSVQASFVDSISDLTTSLLNFFALRYALKPADDEHRFGHGKAEALMSLIQGIILVQIALVLGYRAIFHEADRLESMDYISLGLTVVCISLTLGLVLFQKHVLRKTDSLIVQADSLHYEGDLLINFAVLISLWLVQLAWLDAVITLFITTYILYGTWGILKPSFDVLMDRELGDDVKQQIKAIIKECGGAKGMHALKTRSAGQHYFIQMHLDLEPTLTLANAHAIADKIEKAIEEKIPNSHVVIHQDPYGIETPHN